VNPVLAVAGVFGFSGIASATCPPHSSLLEKQQINTTTKIKTRNAAKHSTNWNQIKKMKIKYSILAASLLGEVDPGIRARS
jgi:hypothetical protein